MAWYRSAVLFGVGSDPYAIDADDADVKLLPSLVEKTLIAKLTGADNFEYWACAMYYSGSTGRSTVERTPSYSETSIAVACIRPKYCTAPRNGNKHAKEFSFSLSGTVTGVALM